MSDMDILNLSKVDIWPTHKPLNFWLTQEPLVSCSVLSQITDKHWATPFNSKTKITERNVSDLSPKMDKPETNFNSLLVGT